MTSTALHTDAPPCRDPRPREPAPPLDRSRALTSEETEAFGRELDALRAEVLGDLGARDVAHIRAVIRAANGCELAGRFLLHVGIDPATFLVGTGALAVSKILENMEIGHNVLHGQYDWTGDPALCSRTYEWDIACTGAAWRHSHNFEHHTFTNILGRDRDVGYQFLRVSEEQPWHPRYLPQPALALGLAALFQWGIGTHDLRVVETLAGEQPWRELAARARPFLAKAGWQLGKDYVLFPALALWNAPRVIAGNLLANGARNVWSFAIIFCGHFPEGVRVYHEDETREETRGAWYLRQLNGSANLDGGALMHVMSGHLSHQIEHHLFPDVPASRYPEIAPRVREICARYGQVHRSGTLPQQLGSVARRIVRLAWPGPRAA